MMEMSWVQLMEMDSELQTATQREKRLVRLLAVQMAMQMGQMTASK
jgi:hypothetical protein